MTATTELPWQVHPAADRLPRLSDDELRALADDIREHGLNEPVWLWNDPARGTVLLDGRHRSQACALAGVDVTKPEHIRWYRGTRPYAFVLSENFHRRHLSAAKKISITLGTKDELLAEREADDARVQAEEDARQRKAEAAAETQRRAGERARAAAKDTDEDDHQEWAVMPTPGDPQPEPEKPPKKKHRARDDIAEVAAVSGRSVAQYLRVQEQAPDLIAKVDADEISLDRAERIIRDREAEAKRVAEARAQAAAGPIQATVDIRHGDFREVLADLRNIDAIITDPPYPYEYLPLLDDLAAWADKVLAPDGVLVILFGQTYLPEVYRRLDGHRPYRWTGCYLTPGPGYVSRARHVQSNWKPLLVYGGGPRFADTLSTEGSDAGAKNLHKWGQDYAAFHTLIERFTKPGQTVVDPFAGSGTTLLAAKALGRHAIGAELDPDHVRTAQERVA